MSAPSRQELAKVILALSKDVPSQRLNHAVAAYLVQNRRTGELDAIMREVKRSREVNDELTEVTATSAYPLNQSAKDAITKLIGAKKTIINEIIDADVIGGVRLETSESQLDLTVRNRLDQLRGVQV